MQCIISLLVERHELVPLGVDVIVVQFWSQFVLQEASAIKQLLDLTVQTLAVVLVTESRWNFFLSESVRQQSRHDKNCSYGLQSVNSLVSH